MPKPTIAITGANGFLGSTLVEYFNAQGWQVIALVRNPPKNTTTKNILYKEYDLLGNTDTSLLKGVDYLVHTAYIKQGPRNPDAFKANVDGAKALLKSAQQGGVKRSVFISSMSANEDTVSQYGLQKLAIEKLFASSSNISLRCGLIIGNGGIVKNLVGFMRSKHVVPLVGGGKQPLQVISLQDLVTVIDRCFQKDLSGVFTVAHPCVYSYKEFYKTIGQQLHIRVLFIPIPFFMLLGMFRLIELLKIPLKINGDNLRGLQKLRAVPTESDLKKIGVKVADLETSLERANL